MLGLTLFADDVIKLYKDENGELYVDARDLLPDVDNFIELLDAYACDWDWEHEDRNTQFSPGTNVRIKCDVAFSIELACEYFGNQESEIGKYLTFLNEQSPIGNKVSITDFQANLIQELKEKNAAQKKLINKQMKELKEL